jgi:hypothetical protein
MKQNRKRITWNPFEGNGVVCRTLETAGVVTNGNFRAAANNNINFVEREQRAKNRVQKVSSEGRVNATTNNCCTGEKKPQPVAARKTRFFFALLSPLFLNKNMIPLDMRGKQHNMW